MEEKRHMLGMGIKALREVDGISQRKFCTMIGDE